MFGERGRETGRLKRVEARQSVFLADLRFSVVRRLIFIVFQISFAFLFWKANRARRKTLYNSVYWVIQSRHTLHWCLIRLVNVIWIWHLSTFLKRQFRNLCLYPIHWSSINKLFTWIAFSSSKDCISIELSVQIFIVDHPRWSARTNQPKPSPLPELWQSPLNYITTFLDMC